MGRWGKHWYKWLAAVLLAAVILSGSGMTAYAEEPVSVSAPSVILVESSTGQVIYEKNATERRSPASVTKIMTLLLTFEQIAAGKASLDEEVLVSENAAGMGGSQVFLAQGESQTLETMIKCIVVASGNDASVAVAEHLAGSEEAFVDRMNEKAAELGMTDTRFEDCCGLTDSDGHYSTARDVAIMSRELITEYPQVYDYTGIWMEEITHETAQGTTPFTLNSTNKLLKQYPYATGLKTGSTSKAKFCVSATARKDNIDLIAVVMGGEDSKSRFTDAQVLLNYGFGVCSLYVDENTDALPEMNVERGVDRSVPLVYGSEFRYLDTDGRDLDAIEKVLELPESVTAPVSEGSVAGQAAYLLDGEVVGTVPILYGAAVERAGFTDYLKRAAGFFLL